MSKAEKIKTFNPNSVAIRNNNFIGLPFDEEEADILLFPVPWDVTVSYGEGTSNGPANILESSYQLDLYDPDVKDAWQCGYFFAPESENIRKINDKMRAIAKSYISVMEDPDQDNFTEDMMNMQTKLNQAGKELNDFVYRQTHTYLRKYKLVGLIGGDHSTPLGYYKALAEKFGEFGILSIDAHMDLRKSYEGLTYSHASIFYNSMQIPQIIKLIQVGVRDFSVSEKSYADRRGNRIESFYDQELRSMLFKGISWDTICKNIADRLPELVVVSIDIDGLDPKYCPNTGTPVPGGMEYWELIHLLNVLLERKKTIIGFDVCEVAGIGHNWDGNVGARIVYKLGNLAIKSRQYLNVSAY